VSSSSRGRVALSVVAVVLVVAAAGCGTASPGRGSSTGGGAPGGPSAPRHWLLSTAAVRLLGQAGMTPQQLGTVFDTPGTFLIRGGATGADTEPAWHSQWTLTFPSVAALSGALNGPRLDPRARAVIYDNEQWAMTPPAEQHDPARAEAQAAALAHAHHLQLIATPATNLARVLAPGQPVEPAYLRLGIAGDAARYADVIDIQAQGSETNTAAFAGFVTAAAAQARAANPHVIVLAGISTNPTGHQVSAEQMRAAITATAGTVDGYWLNIPAGGPSCPRCGQPQPQVAVAALHALYPI